MLSFFFNKKQKSLPDNPNILIYCPYNGGVGGCERLAKTFEVYLKSQTCSVIIVYKNMGSQSRFTLSNSSNIILIEETTFINQEKTRKFDLIYIMPVQYQAKFWTKFIKSQTNSIKIILWTGVTNKYYKDFDLIHYESKQEINFKNYPNITLTPDPIYTKILNIIDHSFQSYYLTIFNPYDAVKGYENMLNSLDTLNKNLIWCFDLSSFNDAKIIELTKFEHPKLIKINGASDGLINSLYLKCDGYICFSNFEGLGWSFLDALTYNKPIAAKKIGFVQSIENFKETTNFKNIVFNEKLYFDFSFNFLEKTRILYSK